MSSYIRRLREWVLNWGATQGEVERTLPGDDLLDPADIVATRAITIHAPPAAVWPWLVQIGPSVVPERQDLHIGDVMRSAEGKPGMRTEILEPERVLVNRSEAGDWVWIFALEPAGGATRLISRNRIAMKGAAAGQRLGMLVMEPGSLVIERKMLLGIKQRAERLALEQRLESLGERGHGPAVDLYWLPLGAGGHFVRLNGRLYEALAARLGRRRRFDLYHSALQVELPEGTYVIEQAPVPNLSGAARGVVAQGAVGSRWAGRLRIFRYEVRLWRGGRIPDVAEAVDSPRRLTTDEATARRVLATVPEVPTPVWGRDELHTGEMWNCNAVIAWIIARSGLDGESVAPPAGGRAPGWRAGLSVARSLA
jgi:hypothetical protein